MELRKRVEAKLFLEGEERWRDQTLLPAARKTQDPEAPLLPGEEQCRFCPASVDCTARRQQALELAQFAFADPVPEKPPLPETLTSEELSKLLTLAPQVEQWIKALRDHAYAEAQAGRTPPGYKLVDRVGVRKWLDETNAAHELRAAGVHPYGKPKLLSPAQAEKALGRAKAKLVAPLAHTPTTGILLVPESDKRPARNPAAEFDAIDE